jgi:hypothetical protein
MAAGPTYEPIATATTSSNATVVNFTSIPSTYTDLVMIMNFSLSSNAEVYINFNSDTTSGLYSRTFFEGNGSTVSSSRSNNENRINILGRSSQMTNIVNVLNYANTNVFKTLLARFSSPSEIVGAESGLWRNTNAINAINLSLSAGNFTNGSVITLYGIAAA